MRQLEERLAAETEARVRAEEAQRKAQEAQRKAQEAQRKAEARAEALEAKALEQAALSKLDELALCTRSTQLRRVLSDAHGGSVLRVVQADSLSALLPNAADGVLKAAQRVVLPPVPPVEAPECGETGSVHAWLGTVFERVLECVPQPPRWTLIHEPQALRTQRGVPDWVLTDTRDTTEWATTSALVEAKPLQSGDLNEKALLQLGEAQGISYAATALRAQHRENAVPHPRRVVLLVANTRCVLLRVLSLSIMGMESCVEVHEFKAQPWGLEITGSAGARASPGVELLARVFSACREDFSGSVPLPDALEYPGLEDHDTSRVLNLARRVGIGGFCDVYASEFRGSPVAVKLSRTFVDSERAALATRLVGHEASVLRELELCASAYLPRCLAAHVVPPPVRSFLVIEPLGVPLPVFWPTQWVDGSSSREDRSAQRNAERLTRDVVTNVLSALRCAHAKGWVHGDIRPSNVVRCANGTCILVDWGAAMRCHSLCDALVGHPLFACDAALGCAAGQSVHWLASPAADVECASYLGAALLLGTPACVPRWLAGARQEAKGAASGASFEQQLRTARISAMISAPSYLQRLRNRALSVAAADAPRLAELHRVAAELNLTAISLPLDDRLYEVDA